MPEAAVPVTQRIAMKAVITDAEGRVLILREAKTYVEGTNIGRYHVPGGRLNPGEPFLEGIRREVKEESGLEVEVGKPLYVGEWWPVIKGAPNQIVAVFFVCVAKGTEVTLSEEHDHYLWIRPEDVANYDLMDPEGEVIGLLAA